ncbi:MAG: hypothetical protein V5A44_08250 [Haloarculaceae archaeon]
MAQAWRYLVGLTVIVALYGVGVALLGAPASPVAFLSLVLFGGAGLLAGRYIADRQE